MNIVALSDDVGEIVAPQWLAEAERVHRQLRPDLPADYRGCLQKIFAGGARMCAAVEGDAVFGVALYRMYETTFAGLRFYVDDLVVDETKRSAGVGHLLLTHLQSIARERGCGSFSLDSGTQRQQAHKFYFREGMVVTSFSFKKSL